MEEKFARALVVVATVGSWRLPPKHRSIELKCGMKKKKFSLLDSSCIAGMK